jgi:hypothetical protein
MPESILWLVLAILSASPAGWLDVRNHDANDRLDLLLNQSEDLGQIRSDWWQRWGMYQPSHMTYQRVDGGIGP